MDARPEQQIGRFAHMRAFVPSTVEEDNERFPISACSGARSISPLLRFGVSGFSNRFQNGSPDSRSESGFVAKKLRREGSPKCPPTF